MQYRLRRDRPIGMGDLVSVKTQDTGNAKLTEFISWKPMVQHDRVGPEYLLSAKVTS